MGLFPSGRKSGRSVALIDIGSASVGGAYARYETGKPPSIHYTARVDVTPREGEPILDSMLRSLAFLERLMIEEGASQLRQASGSGAVDEVVVSIAAPWQSVSVDTVRIEEKKPFTYTREVLQKAASRREPKEGHLLVQHAVIATLLNGYQIDEPYGKRVTRAEAVLLSSAADKEAMQAVERSLRKAFHTGSVRFTAFAPTAFAALRDLFPHQHDFLALDVSGTATSLLVVKRGLLAEVCEIPQGIHDLAADSGTAGNRTRLVRDDLVDHGAGSALGKSAEEAWLGSLCSTLSPFSAHNALPRTVFLLADTDARPYLKRLVEGETLRSLWVSSDPPSVIALAPMHLSGHVTTPEKTEADLFLSLLALGSQGKATDSSD